MDTPQAYNVQKYIVYTELCTVNCTLYCIVYTVWPKSCICGGGSGGSCDCGGGGGGESGMVGVALWWWQ